MYLIFATWKQTVQTKLRKDIRETNRTEMALCETLSNVVLQVQNYEESGKELKNKDSVAKYERECYMKHLIEKHAQRFVNSARQYSDSMVCLVLESERIFLLLR